MKSKVLTLYTCLSLVLVSCQKNDTNRMTELASGSHDSKVSSGDKAEYVDAFDSTLMEGVWWLEDNELHALFVIVEDSLYYTEEQTLPFFVDLRSDTLMMSRDSLLLKFQVKKLMKDSLWLYDYSLNEVIKLYKKTELGP